jgi:hypothetical protein|tara:strand:+ start:384 stop:818 length:435 start_codon:yes stop_codon:yes gene_type:complete
MAHKRTSIRNNVTSTLTGLTTTGSNVFESRIYPNELAKLPLLNIYSNSETSELASIGKLDRSLEIMVEGFAKATSNVDEALDTIAKEVEVALANDLTRGGHAKETFLTSTEFELENIANQQIGVVKLNFTVRYITTKVNPETLG